MVTSGHFYTSNVVIYTGSSPQNLSYFHLIFTDHMNFGTPSPGRYIMPENFEIAIVLCEMGRVQKCGACCAYRRWASRMHMIHSRGNPGISSARFAP